jgi:TolA-binding protein
MTLIKWVGIIAAVAAGVALAWVAQLPARGDQTKDNNAQQTAVRRAEEDKRRAEDQRRAEEERIRDALDRLQKELHSLEQTYEEFLMANPLLYLSANRRERLLKEVETAEDRLRIREAEIGGQLRALEQAQQRGSATPQAMFLLVIRMPGGNALQALRGETKGASLAELIKDYIASLKLEQDQIILQLRQLRELSEIERREALEFIRLRRQEKQLHGEIERLRHMQESLLRWRDEHRLFPPGLLESHNRKDKR